MHIKISKIAEKFETIKSWSPTSFGDYSSLLDDIFDIECELKNQINTLTYVKKKCNEKIIAIKKINTTDGIATDRDGYIMVDNHTGYKREATVKIPRVINIDTVPNVFAYVNDNIYCRLGKAVIEVPSLTHAPDISAKSRGINCHWVPNCRNPKCEYSHPGDTIYINETTSKILQAMSSFKDIRYLDMKKILARALSDLMLAQNWLSIHNFNGTICNLDRF